jgi:hypothetical protein
MIGNESQRLPPIDADGRIVFSGLSMRIGLWPVGSDIVFLRDERWIEKDREMSFTAEVNGRRVPCFLAEDVLQVHFASDRLGRFQAFRENRRQIEEAAARRFPLDGPSLRLDLGDFTEASDFIPWERWGRRDWVSGKPFQASITPFFNEEMTIARNKNQNTFAKRQREQDKKRRADDKRKRRMDKSTTPEPSSPSTPVNHGDVRRVEDPAAWWPRGEWVD